MWVSPGRILFGTRFQSEFADQYCPRDSVRRVRALSRAARTASEAVFVCEPRVARSPTGFDEDSEHTPADPKRSARCEHHAVDVGVKTRFVSTHFCLFPKFDAGFADGHPSHTCFSALTER